jgi:hypothetical protein
MSIVEKLTEGVVRRNTQKEGEALLNKWEKTGLLEGLNSEHTRNGMAALLENQAKEILRESSSMAAGDVEGFAAVAFPIVRRVFGGLVANDLSSSSTLLMAEILTNLTWADILSAHLYTVVEESVAKSLVV